MNSIIKSDYAQWRTLVASFANKEITYISKPGIANWDRVKPSDILVAKTASFQPGTSVILFGARHGGLPAVLALENPTTMFTCVESNWISIQSLQQTIRHNRFDNLSIHQYPIDHPLVEASFDTAILLIPKGRSLARRWLLELLRLLKSDGVLYLGGANEEGVQSLIDDAAEFFNHSEILGYKKGARVAKLSSRKGDAYAPHWASVDGIKPETWYEFEIVTQENKFSIRCLPGVFSSKHLDEGTSLLINHIDVPENARVLDVGSGYGIIGMVAARKSATSQVDLVDVDLMAVASSTETTRWNSLTNTHVYASDLLNSCAKDPYHLIFSNPPFHAGIETNYIIVDALVEQAYQNQQSGGELTLVANRFLRYEKLMENFYSRVFIRTQTNKFHVITGVR